MGNQDDEKEETKDYIDEKEIYRIWTEDQILYHYKHDGVGIRENEDGSKNDYSWELEEDKLTITFANSSDSQIYVVTKLSDTMFSYYNANDRSERHTLLPYHKTYEKQKEREKQNIQRFIKSKGIKVIDMETFIANGEVTSVDNNEFVLFEDRGVYMQIVRKGEGKKMEPGDRGVFMARYIEQNIETGDTISGNLYASSPDYFTCKREGDSYTASFTQGNMMTIYGSSAVPTGWLVPFGYITPGRPNDRAAKVRLILPHSESTTLAAQYVYPTYFEITYMPDNK